VGIGSGRDSVYCEVVQVVLGLVEEPRWLSYCENCDGRVGRFREKRISTESYIPHMMCCLDLGSKLIIIWWGSCDVPKKCLASCDVALELPTLAHAVY
jgi:hypothetical protein